MKGLHNARCTNLNVFCGVEKIWTSEEVKKIIEQWWNIYCLTSKPFFEGELPDVQQLLDKFEEYIDE